jgi:muramoyltetrapeptide carboxypeptidase
MEVRVPPRLRRGDCIGIVSPASPIDDVARIEHGVRYLESCGYRTMTGKHCGERTGYLAGTDEQRAEDLHAMFSDRHVKAILCVRGGYGSPRLLPLLRYDTIRKNPKIFVGYSDITALHLALLQRARLVTYHGPMLGVDLAGTVDPYAEESLWRMLTSPTPRLMIAPPGGTAVALNGGTRSGRLIGGNLSLLVSLLGTPFMPALHRALLFLEEIGEEPYRVDRMFTQLRNAGVIRSAAGVILGQFTDCVPRDPSKPSQSVDEIVRELARGVRAPFVTGLPFGHERRMMTIPVGLRARLDGSSGAVELLEPAVA